MDRLETRQLLDTTALDFAHDYWKNLERGWKAVICGWSLVAAVIAV
ncbi:MAG: hypothetical protein ABEI98_06550 [Halorhabdus sp.]